MEWPLSPLQEWLNFISTEIHKSYSPLFGNKAPAEWKGVMRDTPERSLRDVVAASLGESLT